MKKVMLFLCICVLGCASIGAGFVGASAAETEELVSGCKAAYLCDFYTGTTAYAKNETAHLPIASMCKIMTLVLCFEELSNGLTLDEPITVSETASGMGGSQVFLEAGGVYPAGELIKSICIASANDSCVAMAERIAGGESAFVRRMNERAKELGMNDTIFVNCTGLPAAGQYCCARDVARMMTELMRHEEYFQFSRIWMDEMHHSGGRVTEMANTNKMIRSYQGCDAGKTGYTAEAGYCLAASAERGNMRTVAVVIGSTDSKTRFANTKSLFDHGFANFTNKAVVQDAVMTDVLCPVSGGKQKQVTVRPSRASSVFCSKDDTDEIFCETEFKEIKAPVAVGDVVGEIVVYKNNTEYDRVSLLANDDVKKSSFFDALRDIAQGWQL